MTFTKKYFRADFKNLNFIKPVIARRQIVRIKEDVLRRGDLFEGFGMPWLEIASLMYVHDLLSFCTLLAMTSGFITPFHKTALSL